MCLMLQVSPYPSSEAFPLPQRRLLVVSQGLNWEAENRSCSHGSSRQASSAWGGGLIKGGLQNLSSSQVCLLLSTASCFYQEMSVRKKWFPETRRAWNSSLPFSKHSFV